MRSSALRNDLHRHSERRPECLRHGHARAGLLVVHHGSRPRLRSGSLDWRVYPDGREHDSELRLRSHGRQRGQRIVVERQYLVDRSSAGGRRDCLDRIRHHGDLRRRQYHGLQRDHDSARRHAPVQYHRQHRSDRWRLPCVARRDTRCRNPGQPDPGECHGD